MIKKEYITPTVEVVEMEVASMLANSVTDGGTIGGNPNEEGEELANRRRNFWDEIGGSGW